jgi:hypothetical protein
MRKIPSSEKATEYYELGNGWYMVHVKTKIDGKLSRVDTYVGTEDNGFSHVAHTEGLDEPGVIGGYRDYLKTMRLYGDGLIELAQKNMRFPMWRIKHGKRNTEKDE